MFSEKLRGNVDPGKQKPGLHTSIVYAELPVGTTEDPIMEIL